MCVVYIRVTQISAFVCYNSTVHTSVLATNAEYCFWQCYVVFYIGTCEASWFDSISNRTSDSRFESYWWSDSKF